MWLPVRWRSCFLRCVVGCAVDRVFETLELGGGDFVVAEEGEEEALAGVSEEATHHVTDLGAARFLLGYAGAVEEGSTFLAVADVALLLEDADGGEDGVVGQRGALGIAATRSPTADSPRCQRSFISLSSASVNVMDRFGGIVLIAWTIN